MSQAWEPIELVTPAWAGDYEHFKALRASIDASRLATIPHRVIVQSEDASAFSVLARPPLRMATTAETLPGDVEALRVTALRRARRLGHRLTDLSGSLSLRTGGWPRWVRYTGWHVQQITKLAAAAASSAEAVVVIDCDVLVMPRATPADFLTADGRPVCLYGECPPEEIGHRQARWNRQAHTLLGLRFEPSAPYDGAFDTPFVFHPPLVREMLVWISDRYDRPWWEVLLAQPVRRWSEFATYRLYLKHFHASADIVWRQGQGKLTHAIYAPDNLETLRQRLAALRADPEAGYTTVHDVRRGRRRFAPQSYLSALGATSSDGDEPCSGALG